MPHERGSIASAPYPNFLPLPSPIAKPASAANCQLPDHRQRLPRLTLGKPLTQKNLTQNTRPQSIAALICGCLREPHAPHLTPSGHSCSANRSEQNRQDAHPLS